MMPGDTPVSEALQRHHETGHGRWPIWEERDGQRRIMGLVDLDQLIFRENLDPAKPIGDFIRPAMYLEEDMRLEVALRRMQARGEQLAIVLGRNRRETGTLAVEAILKTMFGEVQL